MDRLDELSVLVAVLEAGSLTGAARRLRRSAPAVTRVLAALEARAGARLIERTTRRLAPTEAGRRLEAHARRLLAAYDEALEVGDDGPLQGDLTVTAPVVFGRLHMTPIVASFLDLHPQVRVELVLNDHNLDMIDDRIDVGLRIGQLADSGLMARKVGEVTRMVLASPAYLARRGAPTTPRETAEHEVIYSGFSGAGPEWRFRDQTVRLAPRMLVNGVDAALVVAKAGRGLVRALSYQVLDDLRSGALVRLLRDYEPPASPVQLVAPSRRLSTKARAFMDHAAQALSALPAIRPAP